MVLWSEDTGCPTLSVVQGPRGPGGADNGSPGGLRREVGRDMPWTSQEYS